MIQKLAIDIDDNLKKGFALYQRGDLGAAERLYREVLNEHPDHGATLNLLGCLCAQAQRHDEAVKFLSHAVSVVPDNPEVRNNLAYCRRVAADFEGAKADYRATLELDPANTPALLSLGEILLLDDEIDEAVEIYQRVLADTPTTPEGKVARAEALCGMGIAHHKQERLEPARQALEQSVELNPESARSLANLGNVLRDMDRNADSVGAFQRAVFLAPENARLRANFAIGLLRLARHDEALREIDVVLAANPRDGHAISIKAVILWELNRDDEFQALVDIDRFVHMRTYDTAPRPFADLDAFHRQLADEVRNHPTIKDGRVSKATTGGQQTGEILIDPPPAIAAFESMISGAVADYVAAYPRGGGNGLDWPKRWRLTAWGVILRTDGYQTAHNHPSGMVSGVYYVRIPSGIDSRDSQEGWLEFGPPNDILRVRRAPHRHAKKPREGAMCLFPSHYWHRTIPFSDEDERVSIAFDAIPLALENGGDEK